MFSTARQNKYVPDKQCLFVVVELYYFMKLGDVLYMF